MLWSSRREFIEDPISVVVNVIICKNNPESESMKMSGVLGQKRNDWSGTKIQENDENELTENQLSKRAGEASDKTGKGRKSTNPFTAQLLRTVQ